MNSTAHNESAHVPSPAAVVLDARELRDACSKRPDAPEREPEVHGGGGGHALVGGESLLSAACAGKPEAESSGTIHIYIYIYKRIFFKKSLWESQRKSRVVQYMYMYIKM